MSSMQKEGSLEKQKVRKFNCLNLDVQDERMKRIMMADHILD
jgi:hypothetical protein